VTKIVNKKERSMMKRYITKLIFTKKSTNFSFTVPRRLVVKHHLRKGSPWQWTEDRRIVQFRGSIKQARQRKKDFGDVVWLQKQTAGTGQEQYKVNIPREILERWVPDTADYDRVRMAWNAEGGVSGEIFLEFIEKNDA